MSQLGDYIRNIREEKKATQYELGKGICTNKELSKIELSDKIPDYFITCALLDRLGISNRLFEYILSQEEYEMCRLRHAIEEKLYDSDWDGVKQDLKEYRVLKRAKEPLHIQYMEFISSILYIHEKQYEKALDCINRAIKQTIADKEIESQMMGADEMKLLLKREYIYRKLGMPSEELQRYKKYIENNFEKAETLVFVYPELTILMSDELIEKREFKTIDEMCKKSLELLNKNKNIDYLYDIFQVWNKIKHHIYTEKEKTKFNLYYNTFMEICKEWKIHPSIELFVRKIPVEIDLDWEIIQKERIAQGMTQEKLSEFICEPETISRIETTKRKANRQKFELMQKKLGVNRRIFDGGLIVDEIELLEKKREILRAVFKKDLESAKDLLQQLSIRCDLNDPKNKQFYLLQDIIIKQMEETIDDDTSIELLEEALSYTKNIGNNFEIKGTLTSVERVIINSIAITYKRKGEKEKANKIWRGLLKNLEEISVDQIFHHINLTPIIFNLAKNLEETKQLQEAWKLCQEGLRMEIKYGRSDIIGFFLCEIADILIECEEKEQAKKYYIQTLTIFRVLNDKKHYKAVYERYKKIFLTK